MADQGEGHEPVVLPVLDPEQDRAGRTLLHARGVWTVQTASALERLLETVEQSHRASPELIVDMAEIAAIDTCGAWLLERFLRRRREAGGRTTKVTGLPARYQPLCDTMSGLSVQPPAPRQPDNVLSAGLHDTGVAASEAGRDLKRFLEMLGALGWALGESVRGVSSFRLTSMVHHLDRVAWQAVPIVLLITFLIGGIIAQQGFFHFREFGAEIYVVDMVGILVLREIGVLIVAIMVAGRSGSSYTAELGSMKMREEIDALRTMGFDPVGVLLLPRTLALVIALPLLTFIGCMSALFGGGLVAWFYGGMHPDIYIARLSEALSTTHFKVGMYKAPFMALVIGIVACVEGLQVRGSAESLGLRTTASVVKAIFFVIVLDGLFAVYFASIGM
ncbi:MAG: MlaE family lipid ABC transporter permease subunit [Rhizobiales bacterium]|nr:MlaE family lipid ABC transporter permease subunit [Hyphomicrobiales bacterium]